MKKVFLVILLLGSLWAKAQQSETQSKTVTVYGRALVEREIVGYKATITLNMEQLYYANAGYETLDQLKEKYFEELRKKDINPNKFKEYPLEFLGYGYQGAGTIFKFETSSKEDVLKLSKVKMTGVNITYEKKSILESEELLNFKKDALAQAQENANRICKAANKKRGELISIADSDLQKVLWIDLYNSYEEYTQVTVSYKIGSKSSIDYRLFVYHCYIDFDTG